MSFRRPHLSRLHGRRLHLHRPHPHRPHLDWRRGRRGRPGAGSRRCDLPTTAVGVGVVAVLLVGSYTATAGSLDHQHSSPQGALAAGVVPAGGAAPGALAPAAASGAAPAVAGDARVNPPAGPPTSSVAPAPPATVGAAPPLAPLPRRVEPDLLVRSEHPLAAPALDQLRSLVPVPGGDTTAVRAGSVLIGTTRVSALAVDPAQFREFAPAGTAEATGVWQAIADGEAVTTHAIAGQLHLPLGGTIALGPGAGGPPVPLRLGALATTNVPGADVLVDMANADRLGLAPQSGLLLSVPKADPSVLAQKARGILGGAATIDLLAQPVANPVAFLTGSRAANAFGAFSYRYFADGTIEPALRWVDGNIRTESVPILGRVTCHRLMFPQLRSALSQVVAEGLAGAIKPGEYGGCYVPRFIESNPDRSVSLHTWGIAIDLNVPENERGTAGQIDRRVVAIFKRWGFRWGGDWGYTDPMHFELSALLKG